MLKAQMSRRKFLVLAGGLTGAGGRSGMTSGGLTMRNERRYDTKRVNDQRGKCE